MPNSKHSYILQAFVDTPWAILPSKLAVLQDIVMRYVAGENVDPAHAQTELHGAVRKPQNTKIGKIAVLPLMGTIFPRANLMTAMSGATSAETFGNAFAELIDDPEISAIVLDVDSPGGQVSGVEELSKKIYDARGKKPIVAVVNHLMASAAYWIGTSADEVVVSPSGDVGSIGVFAVHQDVSEKLQKDGIKVSIIKEGKYKAEANPYEPLSEEARAAIQSSVTETYDLFVEAVARNRGVEVDAVRNGFGQGRVVSARQAVAMGMADRVATMDEVLTGLLNGYIPASRQSNHVNTPAALLNDAAGEETATPEPAAETSEPPQAKVDPAQVEKLRNYLKVYKR